MTFALQAGPALAQTTYKTTQFFPSTHWHYIEGIKVFTDVAEQLSGGKIKLEVYHAGQLGKETTTTVSSGLAQFGLYVPSCEPANMPLTSVVELLGFHSTSCEGAAKFAEFSKEGAPLYEHEYKRMGVKPLYMVLLAPY